MYPVDAQGNRVWICSWCGEQFVPKRKREGVRFCRDSHRSAFHTNQEQHRKSVVVANLDAAVEAIETAKSALARKG